MIIFFGTSSRSAKFLDLATQRGLKIDLVVSEPAKPIGRKQILTENPVVTAAKKMKIPFLTSIFELQNPSSGFQLNFFKDTLGLILDFNKIIPREIINLFSKGIINLHFSKLPQNRGPAPVQKTILNGDKEAWITYYLINEKIDQGMIISQLSIPLDFTENTDSLYEKLIEKAAQETKKIIDDYLSKKVVLRPQIGEPTMTEKLTTENCRINWEKNSREINCLIRAAYPEPGAWTEINLFPNHQPGIKKRLKILNAHLENDTLVLDLVQLEGKSPVSWKQFLQGYPDSEIIKEKKI